MKLTGYVPCRKMRQQRSQNPTKSKELLHVIVKYRSSLLVALLFAFATVSPGCGHSAPPAAVSTEKKDPCVQRRRLQVPENREADDTARFLAGMPGNPGSPFADLEQTEAWNDHRPRLDAAWHRAEGSLIAGLHEFGEG